MRLRTIILCFVALIPATRVRGQTPWERYLETPTPENARAVRTLTYTDSADNLDRLLDDLQLLEDQMAAGDSAAVRLAFRLEPKADGVYGETLAAMLGRLVRINPTLFLRELRLANVSTAGGAAGAHLRCRCATVAAPEFVDRLRARTYEAQQRILALKTVRDPRLRTWRDQCVTELKAELRSDR